jgi:CRISPR/Cas system-associated endonuclease Cas1
LPSLLYLASSTKRHTQRNDHTSSFWYDLCQKFVNGKFKFQLAFLRSEESGQDVSLQHQSTFHRALKRYNSGELPTFDQVFFPAKAD